MSPINMTRTDNPQLTSLEIITYLLFQAAPAESENPAANQMDHPGE